MIPPSSYWPVIAAFTVGAFQIIWNATMYHNPITQTDIAASVVSAGIAFAFAKQCLDQTPPAGQ